MAKSCRGMKNPCQKMTKQYGKHQTKLRDGRSSQQTSRDIGGIYLTIFKHDGTIPMWTQIMLVWAQPMAIIPKVAHHFPLFYEVRLLFQRTHVYMQLVTMGNDESKLGSVGNTKPFKPKGALFFNIVLHSFICGLRTIPHWLDYLFYLQYYTMWH
jgi:hypothetical protein